MHSFDLRILLLLILIYFTVYWDAKFKFGVINHMHECVVSLFVRKTQFPFHIWTKGVTVLILSHTSHTNHTSGLAYIRHTYLKHAGHDFVTAICNLQTTIRSTQFIVTARTWSNFQQSIQIKDRRTWHSKKRRSIRLSKSTSRHSYSEIS